MSFWHDEALPQVVKFAMAIQVRYTSMACKDIQLSQFSHPQQTTAQVSQFQTGLFNFQDWKLHSGIPNENCISTDRHLASLLEAIKQDNNMMGGDSLPRGC